MRSFHFLYGTVEFRAKLGGGNHSGAWPVAWFADASCQPSDPTGTDNDCNDQEIDMAEILDGNFNQVNQQMHVERFKYNEGCKPQVSDVSQNVHTYRMDWSEGLLVFKIDGNTSCTIKSKFVPHEPMYMKFTVFVGGYGGPVNAKTLPWSTQIDYVKISQGTNVIFEDQFSESVTGQPAKANHGSKKSKGALN
jgi:beta-glucanase (GH16 family)